MLKNILLEATETNILTASKESAVLSIIFCNTSVSDINITIYAYPFSSSASDTTTIIKDLTIKAKDTFIWTSDEKLILETGDIISGLGSGVSVAINYKEL